METGTVKPSRLAVFHDTSTPKRGGRMLGNICSSPCKYCQSHNMPLSSCVFDTEPGTCLQVKTMRCGLVGGDLSRLREPQLPTLNRHGPSQTISGFHPLQLRPLSWPSHQEESVWVATRSWPQHCARSRRGDQCPPVASTGLHHANLAMEGVRWT